MRLCSTAAVAFGLAWSLAAAGPSWAQRAGPNVDAPVLRTFNWFGYVGGDDIRDRCRPGSRNRIRLVYNGLWEEQVRTYELTLQPDGTAGLDVGVLADQGDLSSLLIARPVDVTNPWRMKHGQRLLDPAQTADLMGALQASAAFGPPRDGLRLPDNDFWWTVASCRNGVWGFQAYHYPTDGFANVRFADRLYALDNVPVPINKPRKLEPAQFRRGFDSHSAQRGRGDRWMLVVGKDGLRPR
ncbi:MAG: hypothetical protein JSR47_18665 [Proteobacteria bacterium]|nr:hypothetical protein [Pseudomonadota bacterium]